MTRDEFIAATDNGKKAILCVHKSSGKPYNVNDGFPENYEASIAGEPPYCALGTPAQKNPRDPGGIRYLNLSNLRLADPEELPESVRR